MTIIRNLSIWLMQSHAQHGRSNARPGCGIRIQLSLKQLSSITQPL